MIIVINCKSTRTKLPFHHDNKKYLLIIDVMLQHKKGHRVETR